MTNPHNCLLTGYTPGVGLRIGNHVVPDLEAVDLALKILDLLNLGGGLWEPTPAQRYELAGHVLRHRHRSRRHDILRRYDAGKITQAEARQLESEAIAEAVAERARLADFAPADAVA